MRWGKILVNKCFLYKKEVESCNHILLWCLFVYKLWILVYGLLGISWVMSGFGEGRDLGLKGH